MSKTKYIIVSTELHNRFKAYCALKGKTMREVAEELIKDKVEKWDNE